MQILPGLTTTKKDKIYSFVEDMQRYKVSTIALFPTCLEKPERETLYTALEKIGNIHIPHVHLRSDFEENELVYLEESFNTEVFNIHPLASNYPFRKVPGRFKSRIFVENTEIAPSEKEVGELGGLCPDFAHLENAKLFDKKEYVAVMTKLLNSVPVGCCHISAIRQGTPNNWNGEWDHHLYDAIIDLQYMAAYRSFLPKKWTSLELENSLLEQLKAIEYLEALLS